MNKFKYVGRSLVKEDCLDKATGAMKYVCDMKRVDMLYAKLVLAQKAHAEVKIDASEALKIDGIVAVYTHADVPKNAYCSHQWYEGAAAEKDEYIINDKARHVGDRIALVVGETKEAVEEAVSLVKVKYTELAHVVSIESAVAAGTKAFEKTVSCGDAEAAFLNAHLIIEDTGTTPKVHHAAIEPHICLTEIDEQGNLVVWTPCQTAFQVQMHVARAVGVPYSKVRVIKAVMGGSFGGKGQTILEPICAFATWKTRRPVKLYMDRKDAIIATRTRNAVKMTVKTAVDVEGKITARTMNTLIDGGAYFTNAAAVTMSLGKKLFKMYDIKNQTYTGTAYYTNTVSGGACRGYGSPQAHAITEVNIDNVAKALNMDPCEFRLKNLNVPGAIDYTGGPAIGNTQIKACVTEGMEVFNWKNRRENIKTKDTARYAYGVGMACGAHGNGYMGSFPDFTDVDIRMMPDNSVLVKIGVHDQGCGTLMSLQQIAAEALDIDVANITVTETDTMITPYDSAGTQASRVTFVCGGATKQAAEELKEKIKTAYCTMNKVDSGCVFLENGVVKSPSKPDMTYGEVAVQFETECFEIMSQYTRYKSPANPGAFAACFAEVVVDKYTGLVKINDFLAVHDIGQSINPSQVEGQVQGGAHMSLGMALHESIEIDQMGKVKSTNFSKYHLINAPEMPDIKVMTIEAGEEFGPYGAKSVGELAAVAPAPAVMNAINFALGTNIITYPATAEVIIKALNK